MYTLYPKKFQSHSPLPPLCTSRGWRLCSSELPKPRCSVRQPLLCYKATFSSSKHHNHIFLQKSIMLEKITKVYADHGMPLECDVYTVAAPDPDAPVALFFHAGALSGWGRDCVPPWLAQVCETTFLLFFSFL